MVYANVMMDSSLERLYLKSAAFADFIDIQTGKAMWLEGAPAWVKKELEDLDSSKERVLSSFIGIGIGRLAFILISSFIAIFELQFTRALEKLLYVLYLTMQTALKTLQRVSFVYTSIPDKKLQ